MNGNRFGHRLALNLVGGRAVNLRGKITNDGELGRTILQTQNRLSLRVYCTRLLLHTIFLAFWSLLQTRPLLALFFPLLFLSAAPSGLCPFVFCLCKVYVTFANIDRSKMSLKLDLNQLTNSRHKIIKIILFVTFKIKCQK